MGVVEKHPKASEERWVLWSALPGATAPEITDYWQAIGSARQEGLGRLLRLLGDKGWEMTLE